jgi:hypothetical protein
MNGNELLGTPTGLTAVIVVGGSLAIALVELARFLLVKLFNGKTAKTEIEILKLILESSQANGVQISKNGRSLERIEALGKELGTIKITCAALEKDMSRLVGFHEDPVAGLRVVLKELAHDIDKLSRVINGTKKGTALS